MQFRIHRPEFDDYTGSLLQLNLKVGFANKEEVGIEWHSEAGFIENVAKITSEFRNYRGLTPVTVVLRGPPASGKTLIGKALAAEYELPYINASDVIEAARGYVAPP